MSNAGLRIVRALRRQPRRPEVRDLALVALLDRNLVAVRGREIDRRERRGDVERDLVLVRQHRDRVGADLVGGVAVGGDAVGADHHEVDVAGAHQRTGHALGDDRGVDAVAHQLPRGQPGPLQERTRLVGEDRDALALLDRGADHAERRAVAGGGQRAGVAVGQHARAVGHHRGAEARPCVRQLATSSSWIARASRSSRAAISSVDCPACAASANTRFMRSMAQNRLTAVGRVRGHHVAGLLELDGELLGALGACCAACRARCPSRRPRRSRARRGSPWCESPAPPPAPSGTGRRSPGQAACADRP